MADVSDELIKDERSAEEERAKLAGLMDEEYEAQWRRWREASALAHSPITEHATATGQNRYEVEKAVKQAVRHVEEDPAE
ncbi:hypothetical protein [Streptomyces sp. NPDC021622]|uniref:hypothetical protein n=1 Tax=Streptomyces sp. NPDC021622 TaxID=3155013 RepID=UPI0033C36A87